jgi:hypothetical protein
MRQHLIDRPLAARRGPLKLSFRETARCRSDARRRFRQKDQHLFDIE